MTNLFRIRAGRFLFSAALLMLMSGCFQSRLLVKVQDDGSGHIIVTQLFSKRMVRMIMKQMEQMQMQMAASGVTGMEIPEDPFYDEDSIKKGAGNYGPGVTYVKSKKVDRDSSRGFIALYAFEDINDIFINTDELSGNPKMMSSQGPGMEEAGTAERGEEAIWFEMQPGSAGTPARLAVHMPDLGEAGAGEDHEEEEKTAAAPGEAGAGEDTASQPADPMLMQMLMSGGNPMGLSGDETAVELFKKLLGGVSVQVALDVDGDVIESSASHPVAGKPGRVILMDFAMDEILESEQGVSYLNDAQTMMGGMSKAEGLRRFAALPGVTVETEREIEIVFK